jgi:hypothetical protein
MAVIGPAQVVGRIAIWVFASGVQIRVIGSLIVLAFPLVFLGQYGYLVHAEGRQRDPPDRLLQSFGASPQSLRPGVGEEGLFL